MMTHGDSISVSIPLGEHASFDEMKSYGEVLQSFICAQESRLDQIEDVRRHNETIDYLQSLANGYNEQLRIYKQTEAERQRNMLATLALAVGS